MRISPKIINHRRKYFSKNHGKKTGVNNLVTLTLYRVGWIGLIHGGNGLLVSDLLKSGGIKLLGESLSSKQYSWQAGAHTVAIFTLVSNIEVSN